MRLAIVLAVSALALGACGKHGEDVANVGADDSLSAQNITTNDVTAIDAVTGEAANMAADMPVDANMGDLENQANAMVNAPDAATRKPATPAKSKPSAKPASTTNASTAEQKPAPAPTPVTNNTAQ